MPHFMPWLLSLFFQVRVDVFVQILYQSLVTAECVFDYACLLVIRIFGMGKCS